MKYIFDFDDVIFKNTPDFKEHMYLVLERAGVPRVRAEANYTPAREKFSLMAFIKTMFSLSKIDKDVNVVYEEIMEKCPELVNNEVLAAVRKWGPENCYIVTSGNEEFQRDKIKRSGVEYLFLPSNIYTTPSGKAEKILEICARPGNELERFVFFDDKPEFIKEINEGHFPNIITSILYKPGEFEKFMKEYKNPTSELNQRK